MILFLKAFSHKILLFVLIFHITLLPVNGGLGIYKILILLLRSIKLYNLIEYLITLQNMTLAVFRSRRWE